MSTLTRTRIAVTLTLVFHAVAAIVFASSGDWYAVVWIAIATNYACLFWLARCDADDATRDADDLWKQLKAEWMRAS